MASGRRSKAVHSEVERDDTEAQSFNCQPFVNVRCSELRVKGFVLIGGRPCKIVEMSSSKTGKHGSCKVHLVAVDAFTGKKRVTAHTSSDVVQAPLVAKRECRLLSVAPDDGGNDTADIEPAKAELMVEEKSGSVTRVRLCQDKAAELLSAARQQLQAARGDCGDGSAGASTIVVTVMAAMGEEAVVAVRRARDRNN